MSDTAVRISRLLHQAAETHHVVFAITDGTDADWASWYSEWLVNLSALGDLLGLKPVRSELTYVLVSLDKEYTRTTPETRWEDFCARRLIEHLAATASGSESLKPSRDEDDTPAFACKLRPRIGYLAQRQFIHLEVERFADGELQEARKLFGDARH
jgi:hypothetical protein